MSGCHALCVCFFEGYGDPRDLHVLTHAFPTRRSSDLWREHRRESILVGLLSAGGGIGAYTYISYMQKYLFNSVGFDKATATNIIAVALLWFAAMQPNFGALADRFARKPLLLLFGIGGARAAEIGRESGGERVCQYV